MVRYSDMISPSRYWIGKGEALGRRNNYLEALFWKGEAF